MRFGMFIEMLVNEICLDVLLRFTLDTFIYLPPSKYKIYVITLGYIYSPVLEYKRQFKIYCSSIDKTLNKGKCMDLYVRQRKFVY